MGLFEGCLLASDVDDTLVSNGIVAPRCIERLGGFVKEGGIFALSTGRSCGAVNPILEQIPKIVGPSVVANGCMIYDYSQNRILYELKLPYRDYYAVKEIYEKFEDVGIELHVGDTVRILRKNQEISDHEAYERLNSSAVDIEEAMSLDWTKVLIASDTQAGEKRLREYLDGLKLSKSQFINTAATIYGTKRQYFEQTPLGVSKATALKKLCELLNIQKGKCFAIGDYYNDLEMLKIADISACPIDSPDDIKEVVDYVTCTAKDGAVADFIDHLEKSVLKHEK